MPGKVIRIPITNVYDGNDYTAQIFVGSQQVAANVILDTGSSTLAVKPSLYHASKDTSLKPTTYAQLVQYGTGGWAGPVINTTLSMGLPGNMVSMQNAPLAIADVQQTGNFTGVDGILGLAYNALNNAFDFKSYFAKHNIQPEATFPWSFPIHSFKKFISTFGNLIRSEQIPQVDIEPFFTSLEQENITANKFAFYTLRSWVHCITQDKSEIAKDPLNNGFFIMGGGEEQTDLFTGEFVTVDVLDDFYYNTNLKAVQVDGCPDIAALPLQAKYEPYAKTNSIVDSGTSYLALSGDVYQAILQSLQKLNPKFTQLIEKSTQLNQQNQYISVADLNLETWPGISFILTGENGEDIKLSCSPQTYWQVNFPVEGQAIFQIGGPGSTDDANQSILGLPLLNNYYTVFDRSLDKNGVIKFAKIKQ